MRQPNILLITSDQQHWNTIGAFNPQLRTPNLDRLVAEGTTFERAYCPNPTCTPSRASMITGQYPSQHGAWTLGTKLPDDTPTLATYLGEAGYATALVGKAHFQPLASTARYPSLESYPTLHDLEFWREFHGPFYGFAHVELTRGHTSEPHVGQHYAAWLEDQGCADWRRYFRPPTGELADDVEGAWDMPERFHYNAWIAQRSMALIEHSHAAGTPFFCWASFLDPHPPYLVPEPWASMYDPDTLDVPAGRPGEHQQNPPHFQLTQETDPDFSAWRESGYSVHGLKSHVLPADQRRQLVATYYGMVSLLDKYVGMIVDHLDRLGVADETIVIFTTDHGHFFGQHGLQAKGPFHYEDLVRVPLVVRYPSVVPAGRRSTALQSHVDLTPTLLDLTGLAIPPELTGVSQQAVWSGSAPVARDHVICEFHHEPTTVNLRTYIDDRYKITIYYRQPYGELFDLVDDPGETRNLWDDPAYRELKTDLLLRYAWAELGKEPMWMPRISSA